VVGPVGPFHYRNDRLASEEHPALVNLTAWNSSDPIRLGVPSCRFRTDRRQRPDAAENTMSASGNR